MQDEAKARLLSSLLLFTQYFYKVRTGRDFDISQPICRESHYKSIARELVSLQRDSHLTINPRLIINCPPRYGKTELSIHFIAWSLARYPDSNFLYISYSHKLAAKQTQTIRQILMLPEYKELFGVHIASDTSAKDNFETTAGGSVYAAGSGGTITGRGAGIANCDRFGGAIVIDDIHKPAEVTSDTIRESTKDWYLNTLSSRVNSPHTPIIFIGQRLHEDDIPANLMEGYDGNEWKTQIIAALDPADNALLPTMHSKEQLHKMQEVMPYDFAAQYMQNPQPAGGGIFKTDWFNIIDTLPEIISTFIIADTAETDKTYNDATVFSFFGLHKIQVTGVDTNQYGLVCLDCLETWIEPKDLQGEFMSFYADCMRFKVQPSLAAIEKKSTGSTLYSVLKDLPGIILLPIERNRSSGSKTSRFLECQPFVAAKKISLLSNAKHKDNVIEHMGKITANNTHRRDDIADTLADAIQLGLINKTILSMTQPLIERPVLKGYQAKHKKRISSWQQSQKSM